MALEMALEFGESWGSAPANAQQLRLNEDDRLSCCLLKCQRHDQTSSVDWVVVYNGGEFRQLVTLRCVYTLCLFTVSNTIHYLQALRGSCA